MLQIWIQHTSCIVKLYNSKERFNVIIDVALLLSERFNQSALYPFKIAAEMEKKLKRKVDVRILNDAPPSFLNQVFKYGKVVYSRDEKKRVSFEFKAMRAYLDIKPIHLEYNRMRRMRLHAG